MKPNNNTTQDSKQNLNPSESPAPKRGRPAVPFDGITVHLRLVKVLADRLKLASAKTGRSYPDCIRDAVFQWLEVMEFTTDKIEDDR